MASKFLNQSMFQINMIHFLLSLHTSGALNTLAFYLYTHVLAHYFVTKYSILIIHIIVQFHHFMLLLQTIALVSTVVRWPPLTINTFAQKNCNIPNHSTYGEISPRNTYIHTYISRGRIFMWLFWAKYVIFMWMELKKYVTKKVKYVKD